MSDFSVRSAEERRFKTPRAVFALLVREISTTYGRSPGGYFWAIMEPVLGIGLLTVVFSLVMRSPPIGVNFQIYYATGMLPFLYYRDLEQKIQSSIRFSRALLYYPSVTYMDSLIARLIFSSMTQIMIGYLIIGAIIMIWETRASITPGYVMSAVSATIVLGVGVGALNCYLTSVAPLWQQAWSVINRPLLIVSGVIFLHDDIPEPWKTYLEWNPLVHIIGQMRRGFYPNYQGDYVSMVYPFLFGLICLVIGLILLNRFNRDILNSL